MFLGARASSLMVAGLTTLALSACKPDYPKCETDEHCAEKNEVCLNGQCQECREDAHCAAKHGEGYECQTGRCEEKPECRADVDCASVGEGLVCRANKCVPECTVNEDCPEGRRCDNLRCVAECSVDIDCGPGRVCVDGACQQPEAEQISAACRPMSAAAGEVIALPAVRFEFDQYELTPDARQSLEQAAECLKEAPQVHVVVEGHADERGTQEYNLALGEKRASSVLSYLRNLGIDTSRMRTRSKGENEPECTEASESCYSRNRRVQFIQSIR